MKWKIILPLALALFFACLIMLLALDSSAPISVYKYFISFLILVPIVLWGYFLGKGIDSDFNL